MACKLIFDIDLRGPNKFFDRRKLAYHLELCLFSLYSLVWISSCEFHLYHLFIHSSIILVLKASSMEKLSSKQLIYARLFLTFLILSMWFSLVQQEQHVLWVCSFYYIVEVTENHFAESFFKLLALDTDWWRSSSPSSSLSIFCLIMTFLGKRSTKLVPSAFRKIHWLVF